MLPLSHKSISEVSDGVGRRGRARRQFSLKVQRSNRGQDHQPIRFLHSKLGICLHSAAVCREQKLKFTVICLR